MRLTMLDGGAFTSAVGIWRGGGAWDGGRGFRCRCTWSRWGRSGSSSTPASIPTRRPTPRAVVGARRRCGPSSSSRRTRLDGAGRLHEPDRGGAHPPALRPRRRPRPAACPRPPSTSSAASGRVGTSPRRSPATSSTHATTRASPDRVVLVDGDHDLFGDGTIELLFTPGHTPGHQSVRVGEGLVIGGDVSHFASGLDDHRLPIFGDDLEAQRTPPNASARSATRAPRSVPATTPRCSSPGPVAGAAT